MIIDFYNRGGGGGGTVPIATTGSTGVVKIGSGLNIDSAGTLSSKIEHYNLTKMSDQERISLYNKLITYKSEIYPYNINSATYDASKYEFIYRTVNDPQNLQLQVYLSQIAGSTLIFSGSFVSSSLKLVQCSVTLYSNGSLVSENLSESSISDYYTSAQTNSAITQAVSDKVYSANISQIIKITQSDYDALTAKSDSTLYVIVPAATGQPANEIWYTTSEGTSTLSDALQVAVSGFNPSLGNSIVSDTIVNGVGKMVFTNPVTAIPDHAFFDGSAGVLYEGYEDYVITLPEGVTSIGESAFYEAVISGISLPSTLIEIENLAFYGVWIDRIDYAGTANDWEEITLGETWFGGETNICVISCSDSEIDYCG